MNKNLYKWQILIVFLILISNISKKNNVKDLILLKGRKYLNECLKGKLTKKFNTNFINPKITVIVPIYNCQNSIKQVLRSIQNQKMIEIEIILVNDQSKDNSLKIIENIQKDDKRIKIIYNKKNMGILYSRSIGVLQARGKYIFALDNDDMFFDDDVFDFVYKEAENYNDDIVGFKSIQSNDYKARIKEMEDGCHMHNSNFTIYKPELGLFGISKNNTFEISEVHIWSKCIKNKIYKKAIYLLGERYFFMVNWAEDTSMVFLLFNIAESYRYVTKYGIFRFNRKNSASASMPESHILLGEIFFLDIIFDFTENNFKSKKYAVYKACYIKNLLNSKSLNKNNLNYFKIVLKKILFCQFIDKQDKLKIQLILNNL
jgi:glycosyltransferase involved in cell wall biosynthesis